MARWTARVCVEADARWQDTRTGGWNRFVLQVADLPAVVAALRAQGVSFRNDIVDGPGGRQILCEDPSGNVVELFEPAPSR